MAWRGRYRSAATTEERRRRQQLIRNSPQGGNHRSGIHLSSWITDNYWHPYRAWKKMHWDPRQLRWVSRALSWVEKVRLKSYMLNYSIYMTFSEWHKRRDGKQWFPDIKEVGRRVIREVWDERSLCSNLKVLFLDYGGGRQEETGGNGAARWARAVPELRLRIPAPRCSRETTRSLQVQETLDLSVLFLQSIIIWKWKFFLILRSSKLRL